MATFDRRRIQAPDISHPPIYAEGTDAGPSRNTDDGLFLKTGLINQANGSAYIESGRIKIACSVYGPRPKQPPYSPQGSLNLEVKFAPFASHPRRAPLRDTEPAALSNTLTHLLLPSLQLHLLPKSSIDVFLVVLESNDAPSVLSAGLTVASAAIADAGVPMNALSIGSIAQTSQEEGGDSCHVVAGVMPALMKVTNLWMTGAVEVGEACTFVYAHGLTVAAQKFSARYPMLPLLYLLNSQQFAVPWRLMLQVIERAISESQATHGLVAQTLLQSADER